MSNHWTTEDVTRAQLRIQGNEKPEQKVRANTLTKQALPKYIIGIDPGVNTGVAVWNREERIFIIINSGSIIWALQWIQRFPENNNCFLRIEDARKRKWFGNAGREQLQGAGSIKRDCLIWEEFCLFFNIPFELVAPKNNKTKFNASIFSKYTGWKERTNEHSRDAAMLVYLFNF